MSEEPKIGPLPEVLKPGEWVVRPPTEKELAETGKVDIGGRKMVVLHDDTPHAAWVRQHEMGHVRYSPESFPANVDGTTLLAVEDARMQHRLVAAGLPLDHPTMPAEVPQLVSMLALAAQEENSPVTKQVALYRVASHGVPGMVEAWKELRQATPEWEEIQRGLELADEALNRLLAHDPPEFVDAEATARWLHEQFTAEEDAAMQLGPKCLGTCHEVSDGDEGDGPGDGRPDEGTKSQGGSISVDGLSPMWGDMQIEEPERTVRLPDALIAKRRRMRAILEGAMPSRMHRWYTDQQIFGVRTKVGQARGAVLIDASGSMRFVAKQIQRLVEAVPNLVVACYSGEQDGGVGALRVLAADGWRVRDSEMKRHDGYDNNVVDGPALAWLGRQSGRRCWVSDGGIHGRMRFTGYELSVDVERLRAQHSITHVKNMEGLQEELERRGWHHGRR